jgi:hypothetical protein
MPRKLKDPEKLAGHSHGRAGAAADRRAGMHRIVAEAVPQPELSDLIGGINPVTDKAWMPQTLELWAHLGEFPTIKHGLQAAQWDMLARAMMLDDAALTNPKDYASEARLRLAKYGIDPDDLLKLRIQIVAADEAEERRRGPKLPPDGSQSRQKYGPLTAV